MKSRCSWGLCSSRVCENSRRGIQKWYTRILFYPHPFLWVLSEGITVFVLLSLTVTVRHSSVSGGWKVSKMFRFFVQTSFPSFWTVGILRPFLSDEDPLLTFVLGPRRSFPILWEWVMYPFLQDDDLLFIFV